jgi:hypothetical protein
VEDSKKDHDTRKDIKEDICDMITQWIEFPEVVINGITQNPNRLIGGGLMKGEDSLDVFPVETLHLGITIYHRIVPVSKEVPQGIKVESSHKQNQKAEGINWKGSGKTAFI